MSVIDIRHQLCDNSTESKKNPPLSLKALITFLSTFLDSKPMDYAKQLERFDFTKNESIVYVALLELGMTNVGPIVKKTGLHRQIIYQAVETLGKRGYVLSVTKNNLKHFQAVSPDTILKHLEEKMNAAEEMLPDLLKLQSHATDSVEVRTLHGKSGFIRNLRDVIESASRGNGTMRIIGGAKDEDFYNTIGDWYKDYVALAKKHNVTKKLIASEQNVEKFKKKFAEEYGNHLRYLRIGLSAPTYTRMTSEMVTIEIYTSNSDVTIIQIRNKAIAQAYMEHFNLLWKQAEAYEPSLTKK